MWANAFSNQDAGANQSPYGPMNHPQSGWPGPRQQDYRHPLQGFSMQPTFGAGPMGGVVLPPTPGTAMSGPGSMSPPPSPAYQRQQQQGMMQQQGMYMGQGMYPGTQPGMQPGMNPAAMYPPNMQGSAPPGGNAPNPASLAAQAMRPVGSSVVPAGYNSPAAGGDSVAYIPNRLLAGPDAPSAQPIPQLLGMLQESLYPSQREWAAENLASYDWRDHPHVVQVLVAAAGKDPAATVRTECVRSLAKMNVNTMPVITAIQGLKTDADPRVRQAVEDALLSLTARGADR
jgi:hypothetical protein